MSCNPMWDRPFQWYDPKIKDNIVVYTVCGLKITGLCWKNINKSLDLMGCTCIWNFTMWFGLLGLQVDRVFTWLIWLSADAHVVCASVQQPVRKFTQFQTWTNINRFWLNVLVWWCRHVGSSWFQNRKQNEESNICFNVSLQQDPLHSVQQCSAVFPTTGQNFTLQSIASLLMIHRYYANLVHCLAPRTLQQGRCLQTQRSLP